MLINQVAQKYNLSVRTLRYYEEFGLLISTRNESNVRVFLGSEIVKLEEILMLKMLNLHLNDIKEILHSNDNTFLKNKLYSELSTIEESISNLSYKRQLLSSLLATYGSADISKHNVQEFINEQVFFKRTDERWINMLDNNKKITIDVGENLLPLVASLDTGLLVIAIRNLRKKLKEQYNIDVDKIRLRDNFKDLKPDEYQIYNNDKLFVKKEIKSDNQEFKVDHIISNLKTILL